MNSLEEVREFFGQVVEQTSAGARWARSAKLIHVALAVALAVALLLAGSALALVGVEMAALVLLGVTALIAAGLAGWFHRDELKNAMGLAYAEAILAHIESGLPVTIEVSESDSDGRVVSTTKTFGPKPKKEV